MTSYTRAISRVNERINSLEKGTAQLARLFVAAAADQGIPVRITDALRTMEHQAALYAQGRQPLEEVNALRETAGLATITEAENRPVTSAEPGESWHNFGRAFDVVPMDWSESFSDQRDTLIVDWGSRHWERLGGIGRDIGLEWGGDWQKRDLPHFQYRGGMSLAEAREETQADRA